jgi:bacterioferritin B
MSDFHALLNEQIGHEFAASQQYIAIAVWYDDQTMPRLAAHFYRQAIEERNHAMMIVQFLMDTDRKVTVSGAEAPRNDFAGIEEPVAVALEQEKRVTSQINAITAAARAEQDFQGEQFMQWFLKEQVEEVASMSDLLRICERANGNELQIEDYLAREDAAEAADPTAPAAAGGAL